MFAPTARRLCHAVVSLHTARLATPPHSTTSARKSGQHGPPAPHARLRRSTTPRSPNKSTHFPPRAGLNVKYPLDHVLVSVSDASVIVSQAEHYRHAISRLSRANTAAVSFPSRPRNEPPIADLLDLAQRGRQRVELPAAHAEGHCVVNAGCFAARAPELFSVLRAMELENAGSRTFDWLPFFVHLDPHSAKAAAYDVAAPPCTTLAHKHGAPPRGVPLVLAGGVALGRCELRCCQDIALQPAGTHCE